MLVMSSADLFQNYFFFKKKSFRVTNTIRMPNGLDPDQSRSGSKLFAVLVTYRLPMGYVKVQVLVTYGC